MRLSCLVLALSVPFLSASDWKADHPLPGVTVLRNESANWGRITTKGVLPMNAPAVVARKEFDLKALPPGIPANAGYTALRMHIGILDNSITKPGKPNGLTEHFVIRINGHAMHFKTADHRFPLTDDATKRRRHEWMDLEFPARWIQNSSKVVVEIAKTDSGDDFLYPGIDSSVPTRTSSVSFDGGRTFAKSWHDTNGKGEFMMRLVFAEKQKLITASYNCRNGNKTDPCEVFAFLSAPSEHMRAELRSERMDFAKKVLLNLEYDGKRAPEIALQAQGGEAAWKPEVSVRAPGKAECTISGGEIPYAVFFDCPGTTRLKNFSLSFYPSLRDPAKQINMNPAMNPAAGRRNPDGGFCKMEKGLIHLSTPALSLHLDCRNGIRITEIHASDIAKQLIRHPGKSAVFKIRTEDGQIHTGTDADVTKIEKNSEGATLFFELKKAALSGTLACLRAGDEVKLTLSVKNPGGKPRRFTVVFPHLDGLALSADSAKDYYLFPWGGGIIADCSTLLRSAYGANDAWFQLIDLFSPERGGGFYLRIDDPDTIYKMFNLRKDREAPLEYRIAPRVRPGKNDLSLQFSDPLPPNPGIGIAVDYQTSECPAGKTIAYPSAVFGGHPGNWKSAMKIYSEWAHRTWKFRPYPGKLTNRWNLHGGLGIGSPLFDGKQYHTRYMKPQSEIVELISYWTVSEKAPWNTPISELSTLGPAALRHKAQKWGYWKDPATGKEVYAYNRGDYDGYNPQWGGLPALRRQIEKIRNNNQVVILYTDPLIVSPDTKLGKAHGKDWGIINPAWKDPFECPKNPKDPPGQVFHYFSYCMCLNHPDYSAWVAGNMARLIRETGADGIRLDEYGHTGYICLSEKHRHIFPEKGHNVWLRAIAENIKAIRKETDKFKKDALLLSEYPGTDSVAANLDGALCYDICHRTNAIRPLAVNLFRFYFKECKLFELNEKPEKDTRNYWLFNALGVYNSGLYSDQYRLLLNRYSDAFNGEIEPLIDTLLPHVYANRFRAPDGTTIYTIMNMTGHTQDRPLLAVKPEDGFQFVELLSGKKLTPAPENGVTAIQAPIRNRQLLVIGKIRK